LTPSRKRSPKPFRSGDAQTAPATPGRRRTLGFGTPAWAADEACVVRHADASRQPRGETLPNPRAFTNTFIEGEVIDRIRALREPFRRIFVGRGFDTSPTGRLSAVWSSMIAVLLIWGDSDHMLSPAVQHENYDTTIKPLDRDHGL